MGFHVNPQNLQLYDTGEKKQNGEMKFYINAGTDTYRFVSLFQERCEELGINYYFKVIDARKTEEYKRNDKMCIFTEQREADKMLEIIQKIIQEHPEIEFRNPPMLAGKIGEYVGVGMDPVINERLSSYNHTMSKICFDSISGVFKDIPRENLMNFIKEHPEKLQQLKNTLKINIEQTPLSKMFNNISRNKQVSETQDFNNLSIEQLEKVLKQTEEQNQMKREELDSLLRKQRLIEQIILAQKESKELDAKLKDAKSQNRGE